MIYIAGPYWHQDPDIIDDRMRVVYGVMANLMRDGHHCISPMLMHSVVVRHNLPNDFDYWGEYSYNLLRRCDKMIVLTLQGWDISRGVKAEIDFCKENNIPIEYHPEST